MGLLGDEEAEEAAETCGLDQVAENGSENEAAEFIEEWERADGERRLTAAVSQRVLLTK